MPRFFVAPEDINESTAVIRGADAVHIGRSLRMRLGDELTVCCGGEDYICTIDTISDEQCTLTVREKRAGSGEPSVRVTLYQAVPKSDKLELIVQKAVELGVSEIVPVLTLRCVSRPDGKSFRKKQERLCKIALEAAKQCGRSIVPRVGDMISLDECAARLGEHEKGLVCYEKGGRPLREVVGADSRDIGIFIGSEGGFEESEVEKCRSCGAEVIGLGSRILRCETAPLAAAAIVMSLTGNM
ncbi:RsmE family RNA methyltransferase [Ruminococcus sp.]|uniref:RsmE family RNA methyltransferase n=1 Tax=Ruminococcus sp. TaxID=41978 RepID=UPI0025DE5921|nr:RsmE family RNA methyltransferase [Ruminococcus sp.]MBQ8966752.1 16S rRNA (uracil(1498)-N(3))-methyltransferase [Ruminococcus sp.]